jgi:O-antigen ligase
MTTAASTHEQAPWRRAAGWFAHYELLWLALAAPFLLFPNPLTPFAALLLVLVWPARRLASGSWTRLSPLNAPALLVLATAVVGVLVTVDYKVTEAKWWGIFLQVAILFALLNSLRGETAVQRLAALLMFAGLAVIVLSLIGTDWDSARLLPLPQLYDALPRFALGLPNSGAGAPQIFFSPRQVGHTLGMLLPLAMALIFSGGPNWLRLPALLFALFGFPLLLLTGAVMGIFGCLAGLALLAVCWQRWLLIPLALAVIALAFFLWRSDTRSLLAVALDINNPLGLGVVLRLDMWSRALAMIADRPFTGIGLNTFPLMQSQFYTGYAIGPEPHAHQLWLQTALDLGLPGLFAFLWLLVAFTVTAVSAYRVEDSRVLQALLAGLAAGVLAYAAAGTADLTTLGSKPAAFLWAMFGLAAAVWANGRSWESDETAVWSRPFAQLLPVLIFFVLFGAAALLFPAARSRNLALVPAQRDLYAARLGGALSAVEEEHTLALLDEALTHDPGHAQLLSARGGLYAWLGREDDALADLAQRVSADLQDPLARYAPFIAWQEALTAAQPRGDAENLLRVYGQWQQRFPQRAENYVLPAQVRQSAGDSAGALSLIEQGIANGAEPTALLDAYQRQFIAP